MAQLDSDSASARPTWPRAGVSSSEAATLTPSAMAATRTGVAVSSRAKKPGASTFASTWAGRPSASAASTCAVASDAAGLEGATLEQDGDDRLGQQGQPHRGGQAEQQPELQRAVEHVAARPSPWRAVRLSAGSRAVPSATPTMPSGSCTSRSA